MITSNELQSSRFGSRIESHAKYFNSYPINISEKKIVLNKFQLPKVQKKIYINYEKKFLRHQKFKNISEFKKSFLKLKI